MLKNTKIAGIATALTLMAGVALAPTASAFVLVHPSLMTDNVDVNAGDSVEWGVEDIRTGCSVTTTLGSNSVTVKAIRTSDTSDASTLGAIGEITPKLIKGPHYAGEFVLKSQVGSTCKDDAGYKMSSEDVWVGSDAYFGGESDWDYNTVAGDSLAMDVTGYIVDFDEYDNYSGDTITDLGDGVKVLFYNGKKLIASTGIADDGFVSVRLPGNSFKAVGSATIRVALSHNADYYVPAADDEFDITVG